MTVKLANTKEVADFLGYTEQGLAQWRYRGVGPKFIKLGGRAIRYDWNDVHAWVAEQTRQSTGESIPA